MGYCLIPTKFVAYNYGNFCALERKTCKGYVHTERKRTRKGSFKLSYCVYDVTGISDAEVVANVDTRCE